MPQRGEMAVAICLICLAQKDFRSGHCSMGPARASQSPHTKETGESLEDTAEAGLMPWALHSIRSDKGHANPGLMA